MSKLEDFINDSKQFQGAVLQSLEDMKAQRIEDKESCRNHNTRISNLESNQIKVIGASSLIGVLTGFLARKFGGH